FKHVLAYPSEADERAIVSATGPTVRMPDPGALGIKPVLDREALSAAIGAVSEVRLAESIVNYVVSIVRATRESADGSHGASPRSASMLAAAARARGALDGRDYVVPDDVKALALPALRHRIVLSPAAEIDGRKVDEVVKATIERIEAPR